jgi:hypothetical protein
MPYIKQEDRQKFNMFMGENKFKIDFLKKVGEKCDNAGDLNYAITMILKHYLEKKGECYATHNEIVGMLECCKQEWIRRQVSPYEDEKIKENGDV